MSTRPIAMPSNTPILAGQTSGKTTNLDKTLIVAVLDRSGSMEMTRVDAERGFDAFMREQRSLPGTCIVTLIQFDDAYETVYRLMPIAHVTPLRINPRGNTALLDAIGRTIDETRDALDALPAAEKPGKVIILVVTDGEENWSKKYSPQMVRERVAYQRDVYGWQFVFLGASESSIGDAGDWGFGPGSTLLYAADGEGTRNSYSTLSRSVTAYRLGTHSSVGFTEDE